MERCKSWSLRDCAGKEKKNRESEGAPLEDALVLASGKNRQSLTNPHVERAEVQITLWGGRACEGVIGDRP